MTLWWWLTKGVTRRHRSQSGLGLPKVSLDLFIIIYIYIFKDFAAQQEKRLAVLEQRVEQLDKVAEETTRTSQRVDAIEGDMHRFTGALEAFLG